MIMGSEIVMHPLEQLFDELDRTGKVSVNAKGYPEFVACDGRKYEVEPAIEGLIWHFEMWSVRHGKERSLQPLRGLHIALHYLVPPGSHHRRSTGCAADTAPRDCIGPARRPGRSVPPNANQGRNGGKKMLIRMSSDSLLEVPSHDIGIAIPIIVRNQRLNCLELPLNGTGKATNPPAIAVKFHIYSIVAAHNFLSHFNYQIGRAHV